jgi:hypothetical protein
MIEYIKQRWALDTAFLLNYWWFYCLVFVTLFIIYIIIERKK